MFGIRFLSKKCDDLILVVSSWDMKWYSSSTGIILHQVTEKGDFNSYPGNKSYFSVYICKVLLKKKLKRKGNSSNIAERVCIFQESHFNSNSLYRRNIVSISNFLSRHIQMESDHIILNNNLIKSPSSTILIYYQCLHLFLRNTLFKRLAYTSEGFRKKAMIIQL